MQFDLQLASSNLCQLFKAIIFVAGVKGEESGGKFGWGKGDRMHG